jgi:glutathione S-transferase
MTAPYVLYGSYASYYTAKTRALLRKKGIDFVERLPSAPRFRKYVRPKSGSHRIPQLEAPDGTVVQDTVAIFDFLEARHPGIPAIPPSPRQRLVAHLMELLGSEGLVRLAWQLRWFFPEENDRFVRMDFGRSFRPQGTDEELLHYGGIIADRMLSHGEIDATDEVRAGLIDEYRALLVPLEACFREHPYLLGGHPSAADYSLMGALHAHLGRDPAPRRIMEVNAPRVVRWVEHMLVPEIQSPEFFDRGVEYAPNDEVPTTTVALLTHLLAHYGEPHRRNLLAWNDYVERTEVASGTLIAEKGDQPQLDGCSPYGVWVLQRAHDHWTGLTGDDRARCGALLEQCGGLGLLETPQRSRLERRDGQLWTV